MAGEPSDSVEALTALVRQQQERIERLEARLSKGDEEGGQAVETERRVSRAGLLKMAAAGAAGAALAGSLGVTAASASTRRGETTDTDFVATGGSSNGYNAAFLGIGEYDRGVVVNGTSVAVFGFTTDSNNEIYADVRAGVHGKSTRGYGVYGLSTHSQGVKGQSTSSDGVLGTSANSKASGVEGQNSAQGWGVSGSTESEKASGVRGTNSGSGTGGQFSSKFGAQLGLTPSTHTTHPSSGKKGELFVDSTGRLWFCKGGLSWTMLA